ncbi:MAG: GNAT family N-acetyltransferase [Anaerolineaceae bacterium]|nr:GNAT family N-acetyltransferase [Anaerolineaceae bacterium]
MSIELMTAVTPEIVEAFERLIPQLSSHAQPPSKDELAEMAESPDTLVYLARSPEAGQAIVGSATLAITHTPTGGHGWIEDVVVDEGARGQGWGKALTYACLKGAKELGLSEVNLTSRPAREAANAMYRSIGFRQRETNVYRYDLGEKQE